MPIEFNCQVCRQWLSTPDGSTGRQCQCPDCGTLITIPASSKVGSSNPSASNQRSLTASSAPKPERAPSADMLKIPCPRCRFELVCSPSLLGTKGQCRNCQHIFTILSSDASQAAASDSDSPDLVFHCPSCAQLFAGQAEMEGKKGKCHACGEVFAIALERAPVTPPHPSALSPKVASRTGPSRTVASPTHKPIENAGAISSTQRQVPIQFNCQKCSGVMEVPASTSGQQTLCPYCGESLTIPALSGSSRAAIASIPVASAVSSRAQSATPASPSENSLWTALSDEGIAAPSNPYAAPAALPHDTAISESWNASTPRRKRIRGMTFSNAFVLMFDSLFPFCLMAPVLFGIAGVITLFGFLLITAFGKQTINSLELAEITSVQILAYGLLSCAILVAALIFTAAFCMTCNTALHAVRGKHISSRVIFNPGEAYGGMLAIMLGVIVFYLFRRFGVAFIAQEIAKVSDAQTATVIGLVTVLILSLVELVLTYLWTFVPFALLDGQSLPEAIGTSTSISLNHLSAVLPTLIIGRLLFVLVSVVTIGLGFVILMGAMLYLAAAIYHLVED